MFNLYFGNQYNALTNADPQYHFDAFSYSDTLAYADRLPNTDAFADPQYHFDAFSYSDTLAYADRLPNTDAFADPLDYADPLAYSDTLANPYKHADSHPTGRARLCECHCYQKRIKL